MVDFFQSLIYIFFNHFTYFCNVYEKYYHDVKIYFVVEAKNKDKIFRKKKIFSGNFFLNHIRTKRTV